MSLCIRCMMKQCISLDELVNWLLRRKQSACRLIADTVSRCLLRDVNPSQLSIFFMMPPFDRTTLKSGHSFLLSLAGQASQVKPKLLQLEFLIVGN